MSQVCHLPSLRTCRHGASNTAMLRLVGVVTMVPKAPGQPWLTGDLAQVQQALEASGTFTSLRNMVIHRVMHDNTCVHS